MKIGLTGRSCAGKNEVALMMEEEGFCIIDLDKLGHMALEANNDLLIEVFGEGVATDGKVDRKKLGPVVFSSPDGLRKLESISHPWMVKRSLQLARKAELEGRVAVFNAAILHRLGLAEESDEIVFVDAPYELREKRAILRDGISAEKFRNRDSNQGDIIKTAVKDGQNVTVIMNDGDKKHLCRQVKYYCDNIKNRS